MSVACVVCPSHLYMPLAVCYVEKHLAKTAQSSARIRTISPWSGPRRPTTSNTRSGCPGSRTPTCDGSPKTTRLATQPRVRLLSRSTAWLSANPKLTRSRYPQQVESNGRRASRYSPRRRPQPRRGPSRARRPSTTSRRSRLQGGHQPNRASGQGRQGRLRAFAAAWRLGGQQYRERVCRRWKECRYKVG